MSLSMVQNLGFEIYTINNYTNENESNFGMRIDENKK